MADLRPILDRRRAAELTVEPLVDAIADFGDAISEAVGRSYKLDNPRVEKHLRSYMSERVGLINATTRKALHKALSSENPVAAVRHVFEVARTSRAKVIAETEVVRGSNFAVIDAGKWRGEFDLKRWASVMDGDERGAHHEMHNQITGWNEYFIAPNGSKAKWPGGFAEPELSVNCRCAALPARPGMRADIAEYGDVVAVYEDLRRPHAERLEAAWRDVFTEQERGMLEMLGADP